MLSCPVLYFPSPMLPTPFFSFHQPSITDLQLKEQAQSWPRVFETPQQLISSLRNLIPEVLGVGLNDHYGPLLTRDILWFYEIQCTSCCSHVDVHVHSYLYMGDQC